jgi:predicted DsbA family dithiol-disulfide isomerase
MAVRVQYFTDPACSWSWGIEPMVRRLMVEFADSLAWTYVMGGLAREFDPPVARTRQVEQWLDAAAETGMPYDPRLWTEGPITSSYPACMAVKAASEQSSDGGYAYLRALREGLMCFRRKLDTTEALVEEARRVKLDVERFRIDLGSHATVEAFGADLEATRADERALPTLVFGDGSHSVSGSAPYGQYRDAAIAAGAEPAGAEPPAVHEAVKRFGSMATAEVVEVCELPLPRAASELWRLASEWKLRPTRVLTGDLWEVT